MKLQTDGYVVVGILPNEERNPCLLCGSIPEQVFTNLFAVEPHDIPASLRHSISTKNFAIQYRLCLTCHDSKPAPAKIRLLLLERLKYTELMERARSTEELL